MCDMSRHFFSQMERRLDYKEIDETRFKLF